MTCPLIWLRVNLEVTLSMRPPPTPARIDLGFPLIVHLILKTLVDSIVISCTVTDGFSSAVIAHRGLLYFSRPLKLLIGSL
uniref:Uncharacterized protein n=1 Tax=Medicago truncatula TaxID=3880 RepID=I3SQR0_MEDTR|nr:unknown [Medicago truncatula]